MAEDVYVATLREYIDFVNKQVGMYTDACSGFSKNKIIAERQVMRVSRAVGSRVDANGHKIVMRASFEDPSQPDVIHQRIIRASDYIAENSEGGSHEQQHARAIVIFLFTYWEDEIRPRLARAKNLETNQISSDIMGDLRILRHTILHKKSILHGNENRKLKKLTDAFLTDAPLMISNEVMHKIFVLIKQDLGRLILERMGQENGPLKPEEIRDIAIQRVHGREAGA